MIDSLTYAPRLESSLPWADKLEYLQRNPSTEFKPGLNVLFGANGSGKSTLVKMLALTLAAAQGGRSVVTDTWLRDQFNFVNGESQLKLPCKVVHDGQPLMYFDARATEGLIYGSFDNDFFEMGIRNTMAKGSTGELGMHRLERMLHVLMADRETPKAEEEVTPAPKTKGKGKGKAKAEAPPKKVTRPGGFPAEIEWKFMRHSPNEAWQKRMAAVEELLAPKRAVGPKTLILDEPESGFALPWQAGLWSNLFAKVDPEKIQLIIATHSPFALGIPDANYIEMTPGYIAKCEKAAASLSGRFAA